MMKSSELRAKAWESLKGKYWMAFLASLITSIIYSISSMFTSAGQNLSNSISSVDPSQIDSTMAIGFIVVSGVAMVFAIIGLFVSVFVGNLAMVGSCNYFIKNTDSKPSLTEIFSGYKTKYGRNVGTLFLASIKLILWTLLFIIPGIIKTYEYAIIPYILADDPEISSKDAFKKAKEMMTGNKWRLFKLEFSFIGWMILSFLTCGIGMIFVMPYMNAAKAEFYVELKNK